MKGNLHADGCFFLFLRRYVNIGLPDALQHGLFTAVVGGGVKRYHIRTVLLVIITVLNLGTDIQGR